MLNLMVKIIPKLLMITIGCFFLNSVIAQEYVPGETGIMINPILKTTWISKDQKDVFVSRLNLVKRNYPSNQMELSLSKWSDKKKSFWPIYIISFKEKDFIEMVVLGHGVVLMLMGTRDISLKDYLVIFDCKGRKYKLPTISYENHKESQSGHSYLKNAAPKIRNRLVIFSERSKLDDVHLPNDFAICR